VTTFDKQAAKAKLDALALTPANRQFVDYWLSRHGDDGRMRESNLPVDAIVRARRWMVTGEVKPGRSAVVTGMGPDVANLLAYDLRGFDLIEALPPHLRPVRLERTAQVARGAVAHNRQKLVTPSGEEFFFEELIVPFGPLSYEGRRPCVTHVDFSPLAKYARKLTERPDRLAVESRYIDLGYSDRPKWM